MSSIFKIDKAKKKYINKQKYYNKFLKNIDNASEAMLRKLDLQLLEYQNFLKDYGWELSETECVFPTIKIKRNQMGFYVDWRDSLTSKDCYEFYLNGLKFLDEHRTLFNKIDEIISAKEKIMMGEFNEKGLSYEKLLQLASNIGYGEIRRKAIIEENPVQPPKEYEDVLTLLNIVNSDDPLIMISLMDKILSILNARVKDNYEVRLKEEKDIYDMDFDPYRGILIVEKNQGDISMLYGTDGIDIYKKDFEKYLIYDDPFFLIYLRILIKALDKKQNITKSISLV